MFSTLVRRSNSVLVDSFARRHNYLRISLVEKCNLRCTYCMPEQGINLTAKENLLTTQEIIRLADLYVRKLGIEKIRLTGGEPLIRKDIVDIVRQLNQLKTCGLKSISMTTNGLVLERKIADLKSAGLDSVNISLDTLVKDKFVLITRRQGLTNVLKAIRAALDNGLNPVKINCVVVNGINNDEVENFARLTESEYLDVRFIEYMPFDGNKWDMKKVVPGHKLLDDLRRKYNVFPVTVEKSDTAKMYRIDGFKGRVGFISSLTDNFCRTCNRLRITADGNLKVCLFGTEEVNLRDAMRSGATDQQLMDITRNALIGKKKQHAGAFKIAQNPNRPMIMIARGYSSFTHVDSNGEVRMVDTGAKELSARMAIAEGRVSVGSEVIQLIRSQKLGKGDVLAVCRIAGIMAAKRTSHLIPLCHEVPLDYVQVNIKLPEDDKDKNGEKESSDEIIIQAQVRSYSKTGVEMEALTAVSIASLTLYDMCKAVNASINLRSIHLLYKTGGNETYRRSSAHN